MSWSPATGSLSFDTLRAAYAAGLKPSAVAEALIDRIAAAEDDAIWITRPSPDALRAAAKQLDGADPASLPLYGVPFAVKDNIDVAGLETTAACPGFAYRPDRSAPVVERLMAAGALMIGKTNLDQFATGLVGVRSPYGVPRNPFDPARVPGGSSSGSAVAVARGLASFALGTDTAGSGRVPAMFNNIVGLKPTLGAIPTAGVVPACRTLDCVSIFALTIADALSVLAVAAGDEPDDPYARRAPAGWAAAPARLRAPVRLGVPGPDWLSFFGNEAGAAVYADAVAQMRALGAEVREIDYAPLAEAARLLYEGPWVAERTAATETLLRSHAEAIHPVVRAIVAGGASASAVDAFRAHYRLAALRKRTSVLWDEVDALLLPTAPCCWTLDEVAADPIGRNSALGTYTNFVNLMDLSALAVPAGFQPDGLPFGVTLVGPAWADGVLASIGRRLERALALPLGATGARADGTLPDGTLPAGTLPAGTLSDGGGGTAAPPYPFLSIVAVGAHMSGLPLNGELVRLGARLVGPAQTTADYRLYALPAGADAAAVPRPGLVRVADGSGHSIAVEVWDVPLAHVGAFLAGIPSPLGLGTVRLADGRRCSGFLCEAVAVSGAEDISAQGGWRAYLAARRA